MDFLSCINTTSNVSKIPLANYRLEIIILNRLSNTATSFLTLKNIDFYSNLCIIGFVKCFMLSFKLSKKVTKLYGNFGQAFEKSFYFSQTCE